MPTYEYECTACGHRFEASQKMTDKPLGRCPNCSKKPTRLISAGGGIIFKGSGFYATDHRSKEYRKREKEDKGDSKPVCDGPKSKACEGCAANPSKD